MVSVIVKNKSKKFPIKAGQLSLPGVIINRSFHSNEFLNYDQPFHNEPGRY